MGPEQVLPLQVVVVDLEEMKWYSKLSRIGTSPSDTI